MTARVENDTFYLEGSAAEIVDLGEYAVLRLQDLKDFRESEKESIHLEVDKDCLIVTDNKSGIKSSVKWD